jgi:glycosyltransferase involved in cell wall biosynthesis
MNDVSSWHHMLPDSGDTAPLPPQEPQDEEGSGAWFIRRSGLFDEAWYLARNRDIAVAAQDPVRHFLDQGWREARHPNPYFDVDFYLAGNPDIAASGINPLLHYILAGEAQGLAPSAIFDPLWYAGQQMLPSGQSPLAHFLANRFSGGVSPIAEFDVAFYRSTYADLAKAATDPFEHYLHFGFREGRDPSASFDTKFYLHRYLNGDLAQNPLLHWRQFRHLMPLQTRLAANDASVFEQARRNARPGADFEEARPLPRGATRQAKLLAYYLPQFHEVAENNAWWGRGFTEWTAIARAMPRFEGHYQPRIPRDLGCYDLANPATMRRQVELARGAGIHGFVHYFYWFNGRRLLESPTEAMLTDRSLDFPFCLMWANENWSRRWDGSENEVLISQDYREADDTALLATFARHFADPRYIRLSGRPLLMVYRAGIIPDCAGTLARWRAKFRAGFNEDPIMVMAQSFDDLDPTGHGFDGAIEFPPHKLTSRLRTRNQQTRLFDPAVRGQIYDYDEVVTASLAEKPPEFPLIKTALPGWDNDARREGQGMALVGSTPAKYQAWLSALIERSATERFHGERIVCINAWNEWAEGAYLEPDVHYGAAYLNATARAVGQLPSVEARELVLLVGHDAFPAGAQMLLLNIGRMLMAAHGVEVEFLLLGDGKLLPQYTALAPTHVATDRAGIAACVEAARKRGVTRALVNTSVAARAIATLERAGIESVLLVHELPRAMEQFGMLPGLRAGAALAKRVIFPAACVRDAFPLRDRLVPGQSRLLPQGLYKHIAHDINARWRTRVALGVPNDSILVLGAGYGDMRKGLDLFLQAARQVWNRPDGKRLHFCWVGDMAPQLSTYLAPEIEAAELSGLGHFPGFRDDISGFMNAADVFALTSREDPFPSVALEALASGIKVVAFAGTGGIADLLEDSDLGCSVPMSDSAAMAAALCELAVPQPEDLRAARAAAAQTRFDFFTYAGEILAELRQGAPRISVAVLSHNYAHYLPERLGSIFAQTHPVEEILVLDDASTDDSVAVAERVAGDWRRDIRLDIAVRNSGGVFAQWRKAAEMARGEYLWIAEADDAAQPDMLARLARLIATHGGIDLAFCDSRAIDAQGETAMADYKEYYRANAVTPLLQDGVFPARDFLRECLAERNTILNASAVLFRTEALRAALARCGEELASWRMAGDWRVYVEMLAAGTGCVGYLAAPLNRHRRHGASVTARLSQTAMRAEIARMHATINAKLTPDGTRTARQAGYRKSLRKTKSQAG